MSPADDATETGQISVAELLARNGRAAAGFGNGGHRRRAGANGGISVTDLTGELPIVRNATRHRLGEGPVGEQEAAVPEASVAEIPAPPNPEPAPPNPVSETSGDSDEEHVQAWSAQEREPELLSGSAVAVELLGNSAEAKEDESDGEAPAAEPDGSDDFESDYLDSDQVDSDGIEPEVDDAVDHGNEAETETEADVAPGALTNNVDASAATGDDDATGDARAPIKQWLALAAEAGAALVVGGLMFKGFERLWDMLPWVALVLSVMVILGLVALVRVVRRTDDILSFVIAIVVGIFVTIGPLAFLLSTG